MSAARNAFSLFLVMIVVAIAACQPNEGPAERAGKAVDQAADQAGKDVKQAGDKLKNAAENAADAVKK